MRVDIPDDPATEFQPVSLNDLAFVWPLCAIELLRDVFPDLPEHGTVHVMIESAKPVASVALVPSTHDDKNDGPWAVLLIVCGIIYTVAMRCIDKLPVGPSLKDCYLAAEQHNKLKKISQKR